MTRGVSVESQNLGQGGSGHTLGQVGEDVSWGDGVDSDLLLSPLDSK